jgi:hypothetical protein
MRLTVAELIALLMNEDQNREVGIVMELESTHGTIAYSNDIVLSNRVGFLAVTGRKGH